MSVKPAPKAAPHLHIQPKTGARLDGDNLGLLQEFVRKDPESYRDEFEEQLTHFVELGKLLQIQPHMHRMDVGPLLELTGFLSSVAFCFPDKAPLFAENVEQSLRTQGQSLLPDIRLTFVKAIVVLRNKNLIDVTKTVELFFDLVKCDDKPLRKFLLGALISFIRQHHKKFHRPDPKFQAFVFAKTKDNRAIVARSAELVLIDAFRRQFWRDAKTANAIAECVFNKTSKIQVTAIKFFLGSSADEAGDSESDDSDSDAPESNQRNVKEVMTAFRHAKKTKKREKQLQDAKKAMAKEKKKKKDKNRKHCNLEAMRLLFDPQALCDRLFGLLENKKNERYTIRLLQIALVARLIGVHQLQTLGFYSYLHRYLQPRQREVTRILLYAAQACHEFVPTDLVQDLVKSIARNFVSDNNTPEAITVGLNAIREVFVNCPFAATQELLEDLAEYKNYKNKNVSMAARGLIQLFRAVNPGLLRAKDRGRPMESTADTLITSKKGFGETNAVDFLAGAEVLSPEESTQVDEREGNGKKGGTKDDDSDSEGWVDVDNSDSEIEIATDSEVDSDDEQCEDVDGEDDDEEEMAAEDDDAESLEDEQCDDEEDMEEESADEDDIEVRAKSDKKKPKLSKVEKKKQKKLEKKLTAEAILEKARVVSESRILTDEDFKKIRAHQLRKRLAAANPNFSKQAKVSNDEQKLREEVKERIGKLGDGDGLPRLNDITHFHKKVRRQTKAERLEQVKEGRTDRDLYKKRKKNGPHVGRTNANLAKNKNFQMIRQKVRGKNRQRSFRDQQQSLRNYLLRQAGRKPGNV